MVDDWRTSTLQFCRFAGFLGWLVPLDALLIQSAPQAAKGKVQEGERRCYEIRHAEPPRADTFFTLFFAA